MPTPRCAQRGYQGLGLNSLKRRPDPTILSNLILFVRGVPAAIRSSSNLES